MATKARLKEHYTSTVIPSLVKEFGYENVMAVPKLEKISINMGMGEAASNSKVIDTAVAELTSIAGQKPIITKAKKSSPRSSCVKECRSVSPSRCAASRCTKFSIVW
jgi:ribosomal protein L5